VSLTVEQVQVIQLGLLQFRGQLADIDDTLGLRVRTALSTDAMLLAGNVRTMAGALDDLTQALQSALGFPVAAEPVEEREEVGVRG
jgi:hypothetical protein